MKMYISSWADHLNKGRASRSLHDESSKVKGGGQGWMGVLRMGSLKQVYSFILLSAHVELDLTLVISERIRTFNEALENYFFFTFTFCMKA